MSRSRQAIFDRIRSRPVPPRDAPVIDPQRMVQYDDLRAQFCDAADFVGATTHRCGDESEVLGKLHEIESFAKATTIVSTIEAIPANFDPASVASPQELAGIDWMVLRGRFAVAENGAIWVPADEVADRVQVFITQHLAIVVDADAIEPHMHAAYDRIGRFAGYGVFVSGPSKTADIEQSLVLGAHGCRTLDIFLIG